MTSALLAGASTVTAAGAWTPPHVPQATAVTTVVASSTTRATDVEAGLRGRQGVLEVVDDDVRMVVEEDEVIADEAVLQLLGELGQRGEDLRRHRRQRNRVGIRAVDLHPGTDRVLVEDRRAQLLAIGSAE